MTNISQKKFDKICHDYDIILLRHTHNIKHKEKNKYKIYFITYYGA